MRKIVALLAVLLAASASAAHAKDYHAGSLDITGPWSRATPKGAPVAAGYLTIKNDGTTADRLVGVSSDAAAKVKMHEMSMANGVMKMRPITGGLEIKPGETVELKPEGLHLMFIKPKSQLKQGDHVKATLEFEKAGKVDVDFDVTGMGGPPGRDMTAPKPAPKSGHDMPGMKM
jgi:copper(I)-binding protein